MSNPTDFCAFGVTAADLAAYDWQALIGSIQPRECQAYLKPLRQRERALEEAGDDRGRRVFSLLATVASFWPNYDSYEAPYGPMLVLRDGRHSAVPEDLAEPDLEALQGILTEVRDPELRARVADVLWIRRKAYKAAQVAVDAYLESSRALQTGSGVPPFAERLQRARQVGAQLGRFKEFHQKALRAIEDAITRCESPERGLLCARLMHMLLDDGSGDPDRYARLAEQLALRMEAIPEWDYAREYWLVKAGWDAKAGRQDAVRADELRIAGTYLRLAEASATAAEPSFLGASHWMAKAVRVLREAKADPGEIEQAHRRLLDYQRRGMAEMKTVHVPLQGSSEGEAALEDVAAGASNWVRGHPFENALLRLAFVATPLEPSELRKRVEASEAIGVFTQLFGQTMVRADGKTSDTRPPLASGDPECREEAVLKAMYHQARDVDWPIRVQCLIEPARQRIVADHPAQRVDLLFLVMDNPFVPGDRRGLFLRGLHAGLHGDVVLALHLLLPQVENSIREILTAHGVVTSKLESDGTQDERDLGWMITRPEMAEVFGEAMAFDLRGVLVERFGLNLRNDLAHGLLAESQFITPGAIYAWWLILRLCCIPLAYPVTDDGAGVSTCVPGQTDNGEPCARARDGAGDNAGGPGTP